MTGLGIGIGIIGAGLAVYMIRCMRSKTVHESESIIALKNALLTFALATARKDDIDQHSFDYRNFDGSTLPNLAGCSLDNACFSYIVDKSEFRKDPWYTKIMADKLVAIDRYLSKNLDTNDKVVKLFLDFIESQPFIFAGSARKSKA